MKKTLLYLICFLTLPAWAFAQQVVEDFEESPVITLNQLANGTLPNDSLVVVANPDPDALNGSAKVLRFRRSSTGDIWAGFWSELPEPVNMTQNKYVLVKVWKPRISVVKFKVEGGTTDPATFELPSVSAQTKTGEWEQLVFHFPNATGTYPKIAILPDFNDPVNLTSDIVLFIDDIVFSPTATGEPLATQNPAETAFDFFPNPAKTTLYLKNLMNVESIAISTLSGQRILQKNNISSATEEINVSSFASGIYMLSVESRDGKKAHLKFIKE